MIGARSLAFGWWWGRTDVVADPQRSQLRFIDASRQGGAVGDRECRAVSLVRILYVGGPTAVIEIGAWRVITDPTFDPAGGRYFFGWGTASRKLHGPAIEFSELGRPVDRPAALRGLEALPRATRHRDRQVRRLAVRRPDPLVGARRHDRNRCLTVGRANRTRSRSPM